MLDIESSNNYNISTSNISPIWDVIYSTGILYVAGRIMSGNTVHVYIVWFGIILLPVSSIWYHLSGSISHHLSIRYLKQSWSSCSDGTSHCCGLQHCWRPPWVHSDIGVHPRPRWISWIYQSNRGMAFWYQLSGILPETPIHRFRSLRSSKHNLVCDYSWWERGQLWHRYFGWEGPWRDLCSDQRRMWSGGVVSYICPRRFWRAVRHCAAILVLPEFSSNPIWNLIQTRASVRIDVIHHARWWEILMCYDTCNAPHHCARCNYNK